MQGHHILEARVRWRVCNEECIQMMEDRWFPLPYGFQIKSRYYKMPIWVKDLIDPIAKTWKSSEVSHAFLEEEAPVILRMPLSTRVCLDKQVWHFSKQGESTVITDHDVTERLHPNCELSR